MCAHSPESQLYPGLYKKCGQKAKGGVSVPLLHSALHSSTAPECCIQLWHPQYRKERHGLLELVQKCTVKMVTKLEHLSSEKRLRELGLFSVEKR